MEDRQLDPFYYIDVAYRRKWLIIIPVLVGTAIGLYWAATMPSLYRSTTTILVEKQQVPEAYVTPTDKTPFAQRLNTMSQQILSRTNLEKVINDYNLSENGTDSILYKILNKIGVKVKTNLSAEDLIEQVTKGIEIKVMGDKKEEDAFSISYTNADPNLSMRVTNALASLFINENLKARERYAEGTSDFLSEELAKAKKELDLQENAVRKFKERYMGSLPQQLDANLRTLDRLQMELQTVDIEQKNAEDRLTTLNYQLEQTDTASSSNGSAISSAAELDRLKKDLAALRSIYKDNYPDVVMTKKRIDELKAVMAKTEQETENNNDENSRGLRPGTRNSEIYTALAAAKSQIAALKQRKADIRKEIGLLEKHVEETPASEQRFSDLRRDYDISLKNYQVLLEKKLNAKLAENLEKNQKGEHFKVIDPANLPERPYNSKKKLLAVFGGATSGVGISFVLIYLLESMNPPFRKSEELEAVFPQPVLAVIPFFSLKSTNKTEKN